jgi:hypothetical protein
MNRRGEQSSTPDVDIATIAGLFADLHPPGSTACGLSQCQARPMGEDKVNAQPGSFVYMPPMLPHGILAKTSLRMLLVQMKNPALLQVRDSP